MAKKVEEFLNISALSWADLDRPLFEHRINAFKPLLQRLELSNVELMKG